MSAPTLPPLPVPEDEPGGTTRRRFLTYLVAAPTLAVAVNGLPGGVAHALPGSPEYADVQDLGDFLILCQRPTEGSLIILTANEDGTVSCDLPRMEVGQGINTACAMLIADELSLPLDKVLVTLAPARPELLFGQITGGSNTIRSVFEPIKAAGAAFRGRMAAAGAVALDVSVDRVRIKDGAVLAADGRSVGFGQLAKSAAASGLLAPPDAPVAPASTGPVVGTPQNRRDARAMVTGRLQYTMDLEPDVGQPILRSMVRRAPYIRGRVVSVDNEAEIRAMPGVVDLAVVELSKIIYDGEEVVETGVAVVAETSGQALDAKEALVVTWDPGPLQGYDDERIKTELRGINPKTTIPDLPLLAKTVSGEFDFAFVSHAPLESNCAIADVRPDGTATIWSGVKIPIIAAQTIADELGLDPANVTMNVVQGGGSFGRKLFFDGALEAAVISKAVGKPVKHLWTRVDDMRHGRARAASHHHVAFAHLDGEVLALDTRAAFVETDWRHGLGEMLTAFGTQLNSPSVVPLSLGGNATFSQSVFYLTVASPYATGSTVQALNELNLPFNTAAWRSVYSPNTRGAEEVMVDELAASMGEDPGALRLRLLESDRDRAVLQKALDLAEWGKEMPAGFAQGIGFHHEYKSSVACVVEIDARDPQDARVVRATMVADVGKPINPRGLEAQLIGQLTDGIATTLTAGLHLEDGLFLEGSYSQFDFPRQRDTPPQVTTYIFPENSGEPGGAGELGVTAAVGAIANAYARATGTKVRSFPLYNPIDFTPFPKGTGSTRRDVPPPK